MTHDEAEDIVWDLIQAVSDRDNFPTKRSYAEELEAIRQRVVALLTTGPQDYS